MAQGRTGADVILQNGKILTVDRNDIILQAVAIVGELGSRRERARLYEIDVEEAVGVIVEKAHTTGHGFRIVETSLGSVAVSERKPGRGGNVDEDRSC